MPLLRVLVVDDSEADTFLLLHQLRRSFRIPEYRRVDRPETFLQALDEREWDVIICDFRMPLFDGFAALKLYKEAKKDIPFIVVSGMIGEDAAVGMMKAGAHDYLLKDNLARLVPAIEREMREAEERRRRHRAEQARAHLAAIVASSDDAILSTSLDGTILTWNAAAEQMFGYTGSEIRGQPISMLIPSEPENSESLEYHHEQVRRRSTIGRRKDGSLVHLSLTISPIRDQHGITSTSTIARDITEMKQAEAEREKLLTELQRALSHVKTLNGLLPICAGCKKIRDDKGYWQQVEIYIKRHSDAEFTHGFCPDCMRTYYPDYAHVVG